MRTDYSNFNDPDGEYAFRRHQGYHSNLTRLEPLKNRELPFGPLPSD